MKKRIIIGMLTVFFIISLLASMYYVLRSDIPLFMTSFVICTIIFIITVNIISTNKTEIEKHNIEIDNLLRINSDNLEEKTNYPDLTDKNIIKLDNLDDMLDKSERAKTNIIYVKTKYTCSFILIIDNDAYIYIIKRKEDDISALEIIIKDIETIKKEEDIDVL